MDSSLVESARDLARRAHEGQFRKAGRTPYFTHVEEVAKILRDHDHDDDVVVAAAYLHDVIEDCDPSFAAELRATMPREVVETVEALTEPKLSEGGQKLPKAERFDRYVAGLRASTSGSRRALPVSCADKIHNLTSLVVAERAGERILTRLSTRPGQHREQALRLRELYAGAVSPSLLAAFDGAVRELSEFVKAWLPGRAAVIAAEAHLGQFDRAGLPYFFHPMHLAAHAHTLDERVVALLHDVVEDTDWDLAALAREGFSTDVLRALDALTRRESETYDDFIERVARDRLATRVKLLDLAHNSDLSRLSAPSNEDRERVAKYARARRRLEDELQRRNLYLRLDDASRERARAFARLPVPKADHVTLARRVDPAGPVATPGGIAAGAAVTFHAVASHENERVQAWVVNIAGTTVRPFDGGTLHLTVSRAKDARSRDANDVVRTLCPEPMDVELTGTVEWVDE